MFTTSSNDNLEVNNDWDDNIRTRIVKTRNQIDRKGFQYYYHIYSTLTKLLIHFVRYTSRVMTMIVELKSTSITMIVGVIRVLRKGLEIWKLL